MAAPDPAGKVMVVFEMPIGDDAVVIADMFVIDLEKWRLLTAPERALRAVDIGLMYGMEYWDPLQVSEIVDCAKVIDDPLRVAAAMSALGKEFTHFGSVDLVDLLEDL